MFRRLALATAALALGAVALVGCSQEEDSATAIPAVAQAQALTPALDPPTPEPSAPTPEPSAPTPEATSTPQTPDVLFRYTSAVQLLNAAQYEDAIPQFDFVIRLLPDLALAYNGRGLAHLEKDNPNLELALEDFDKAVEVDPDFADAYLNRALAHSRAGEQGKSIDDLQKALRLYIEEGEMGNAGLVRTLLERQRSPSSN